METLMCKGEKERASDPLALRIWGEDGRLTRKALAKERLFSGATAAANLRLARRQGVQRGVPPARRSLGEGHNPVRQFIVDRVEIGCRNVQQRRQPLGERKRRRVLTAFIATDACTGRRLVQTGQNAEAILGKAAGQPRFAQALAENRRRSLEDRGHPSIIVGSACAVSTNCVEFVVNVIFGEMKTSAIHQVQKQTSMKRGNELRFWTSTQEWKRHSSAANECTHNHERKTA